jgi:hypothetical protein
VYFFAKENEESKFYFNFDKDLIFLSSRFRISEPSTETFRLRELSTLMSPLFLSRLRRVVVTYSGLDDYTSIGHVLRWYLGLQTLYIGMVDWWSESSVKTKLRRGKPQVGFVASRVKEELKRTEDEETDDEGESEEEYEERMRLREGRRVIECKLRLDEQG